MKSRNIILAVLCTVTAALAISQGFLWVKYSTMSDRYESQLDINFQLAQMIEKGVNPESDTDVTASRGTTEPLPAEIEKLIDEKTLMADSPVIAKELAYLTIPYYNYDGQVMDGHMICSEDVADEVLDIFAELFDNMYPIQSIEIAEEFEEKKTNMLSTIESASKGSNNTTCLMYKTDGDDFDKSAYGLAIDINPLLNPDTSGEETMPRNAVKYADRDDVELTSTEEWAIIREDSDIVEIFERYGWKWRGDDGRYGRFEKE